MSTNLAVLAYLQQLVKNQPLNIDVEGVEIAMNVLAEAFNIDMTDVSDASNSVAQHNQDFESILNAGLQALNIPVAALEGPTVGSIEHFTSYVEKMKKKNYFGTLQEGTPEFYNKYDELVKEYITATSLDESTVLKFTASTPENISAAEALKNEGNALLGKGDLIGASEKYTQAIKKNPLNHVFWLNRAVALHKQANYDRAVLDAERSATLCPTYLKAHYRIGLIRKDMGKFALSKAALQRAYELAEDDTTRLDIQDHIDVVSEKEKSVTTAKKAAPAKKKAAAPVSPAAAPGMPGLGGLGGGDLASMMNNPNLMGMMNSPAVQNMLNDPAAMQNLMNNPMLQGLMSSFGGGAPGAAKKD